jgi:predicted kinase
MNDLLRDRTREMLTPDAEKIAICMVGLPGRGKSFIAQKLTLFLAWKGNKAKLFNVGDRRRELCGGSHQSADFFSKDNSNAAVLREKMAEDVLSEMLHFFEAGGEVAIYDATNSTKARRSKILAFCRTSSVPIRVVFVESICNDPTVLMHNIRFYLFYSYFSAVPLFLSV